MPRASSRAAGLFQLLLSELQDEAVPTGIANTAAEIQLFPFLQGQRTHRRATLPQLPPNFPLASSTSGPLERKADFWL